MLTATGKWTTISLSREFWYQWCYTFRFGNQTFTARRSVQPIALNLTNVPTIFHDRICGIFISVVSYNCLSFTRIRWSTITSSLKMLSLKDQDVSHCCDVLNYFPCRCYSYLLIKIRKASKHKSLALVYLIRYLKTHHLPAIHW